jgi:predicted ATPase
MQQIVRHVVLLRDKVPDWKTYPFSIPAISSMGQIDLHPSVTFLVGENGMGKSTLAEAIAIKAGFNPEGGTKNFRQSNRPSESILHGYLRMARGATRERGGFFLRAETMFNVATEAETEGFGEYGWEALHDKSHGEAFLWLALKRFHDRGLYILDEPESALSPRRQLAFLARMHELVQGGSQFVISTHSVILMSYPDARILVLDEKGIRVCKYEETDHFVVTRAFIQDPAGMLKTVLSDDDRTRQRGSR